jgi:hypothetical protein
VFHCVVLYSRYGKTYAVVIVAAPHQTGDVQRGAARGDATAGDEPAPPHAPGATAAAGAGVQGGAGVAGAGQKGEAPCGVRRVQPLQHGGFSTNFTLFLLLRKVL